MSASPSDGHLGRCTEAGRRSPGIRNFPLSDGRGCGVSLRHYLTFKSSGDLVAGYNRGTMPRIGEFCPSNVARLLLGVVIVVALVAAVGVWLFHSPGRGTPIEQSSPTAQPVK
jgi:hypothetical protein